MRNPYLEKIKTLINNKKFKTRTLNEIKDVLEVRNAKKERELYEALQTLCAEGLIVEYKGKYLLPENAGYLKAEVIRSANGYLFVKTVSDDVEYFVPPGYTKNAILEDIVFIKVVEERKLQSDKNKIAHVKSIVHRDKEFLVGTYLLEKGESFVEVNTKNTKIKLRVLPAKTAVEGHEVVIKINEDSKWEVSKVLGHRDEPTTEIMSILYNYGIKSEFDEETIREADEIESEIPEMEYYTRRDLRADNIITIDGKDAKDLDDAVQLRVNEKGNYILGVHIADVSYYVTKGSYLDNEAFTRGTSVYLTNKVVPMLPQRLSNGICSLLPGVERLAMSCEMEIDKNGDLVAYEIFESIIQTKARLTYDEVNGIIQGAPLATRMYDNLEPVLLQMNKLAQILRTKRFARGSVDFDVKEPKIILDKENVPIDIEIRERAYAEKLIEEFMLVANETVATHFSKSQLPFIYRIHDLPAEGKVEALSYLVTKLGYPELSILNHEDSKEIQRMVERLKGTALENTVQRLAIRMMSKAVYSEENIGHYGLSKDYYTHFTSPIRRYPDLVVHRLIREFLLEHNITKKSRDYWAKQLPEMADYSSRKEQKAAEAERELLELKKAEYMKQFVGLEFEGVVSNVTENGFYVELENTVQGYVPKESLLKFDNNFYYEEDGYALFGDSLQIIIGDTVLVKLVDADKYTKKIVFELINKK